MNSLTIGLRDQARPFRIRIRRRDVNEAGQFTDIRRDNSSHPVGNFGIGVGFRTRLKKFRIIDKTRRLGDPHKKGVASQGGHDGRQIVGRLERDGGFVVLEHPLLLLLDLNDGGGDVFLRLGEAPDTPRRPQQMRTNGQKQPDIAKKEMEVIPEV